MNIQDQRQLQEQKEEKQADLWEQFSCVDNGNLEIALRRIVCDPENAFLYRYVWLLNSTRYVDLRDFVI